MKCLQRLRRLGYLIDELRRGAEQEEGAGKANGQEGTKLDDGFQSHSQNKAILVFCGVGVARTEQDRKDSQHSRDGEEMSPNMNTDGSTADP